LLEKVREAKFEEQRREAEQKIVEESIKRARKVGEVAQRIAEMYAFAETAWKAKNYALSASALAKVRELEEELEKVYAEDKEWTKAYWKVIKGEI